MSIFNPAEFDLSYHFDENLRDVPDEPDEMRRAVSWLREAVQHPDLEPRQRIRLYGLLGGCARMLGKLAEAERALATALALAVELEDERLQVANRLRLAHVYHWQRNFERADRLLADLIELCKREPELAVYLDFAYQHAGKCKFDQEQYTAAQRFFTRALAIRQQKGDLDLIASTQHALAVTCRRMAAGDGR